MWKLDWRNAPRTSSAENLQTFTARLTNRARNPRQIRTDNGGFVSKVDIMPQRKILEFARIDHRREPANALVKIALYNLYFSFLGGGERRTSALAAHLARNHNVTIFVQTPVSIATIKTSFGLDLSNVEIIPLEHKDHSTEIARYQPDLFINNSWGSTLPNPACRGIYMCMFPANKRIDLRSYQIITANSRFTANWIKKKWGLPSEVVYSACQNMGPPSTKEKIILHVARFSANENKRQDTLLIA